MKKVAILFFALILLCAGTINAQVLDWKNLTFGIGANYQGFFTKSDNSRALGAMRELMRISGGRPETIPNNFVSNSVAPKAYIGYEVPFDEKFTLGLSLGISQDYKNSFVVNGLFALQGRTIPYPKTLQVSIYAMQKINENLFYGGEITFDNQNSEFLINRSNIPPTVAGLINQISSDINLLNDKIKANAQIGWKKEFKGFGIKGIGSFGYMGGGLNWGLQGSAYINLHTLTKKETNYDDVWD